MTNSQEQGHSEVGRERQKETEEQMQGDTGERIRQGWDTIKRQGEVKGETVSQRHKEKLSGRNRQRQTQLSEKGRDKSKRKRLRQKAVGHTGEKEKGKQARRKKGTQGGQKGRKKKLPLTPPLPSVKRTVLIWEQKTKEKKLNSLLLTVH